MKTITFNKTIQGYALLAPHYKNCVMSIRFFIDLKPIENTKLALLAQLIKDRNKKHPSKSLMQAFKDNLYGAQISSRTFGYGPTQVLEVRLSALSERFVNEPLQAKQLQGLSDLIYQPLINYETLKEAKRSVKDKINRSLENPTNLAINRTLEILGPNSTLGLNTQGELSDLEHITEQDMIEFHQEVLLKASAQLIIGGNFREGLLNSIDIVFQYHHPLSESAPFNLFNQLDSQQVIETKSIQQASLIEAYQTSVSVENDLSYALRMGNLILGQLPTSHLFQEVREKHSLCYSVSSRVIAFEGLLLLITSLDENNINKAASLMNQQINRIKAGDFSPEQLESAKKMMVSSFDSIFDDEYAMINFIFDCAYRNLSFNVEDHKSEYQKVTKEMIQQAFSEVQHVLEYQLKGISNEN